MASVNYDPVKAHEYYEKHKKLKGRLSTKGFNQQQREQLAYAREQLQGEKKERDAANKEALDKKKSAALEIIRAAKERQKEQLQEAAAQKIEQLRGQLDGLPADLKKSMRRKIANATKDIRAKLSDQKKQITADSQAKSKNVRSSASAELKQKKAQSKATYDKDLDAAYKKIKG